MSSRLRVVLVATAFIPLGIWGVMGSGLNPPASDANVIFIVLDGVGAERVPFCGNTDVEMENIVGLSRRAKTSYTCAGTADMSIAHAASKELMARGYQSVAYSTRPTETGLSSHFETVRVAKKWRDYGTSRRFGSGLRRVLAGVPSGKPSFLFVHIAADPEMAADAAVLDADVRLGVVLAQVEADSYCERGCRIVVTGNTPSGAVPVVVWGAGEELVPDLSVGSAALGELVTGP